LGLVGDSRQDTVPLGTVASTQRLDGISDPLGLADVIAQTVADLGVGLELMKSVLRNLSGPLHERPRQWPEEVALWAYINKLAALPPHMAFPPTGSGVGETEFIEEALSLSSDASAWDEAEELLLHGLDTIGDATTPEYLRAAAHLAALWTKKALPSREGSVRGVALLLRSLTAFIAGPSPPWESPEKIYALSNGFSTAADCVNILSIDAARAQPQGEVQTRLEDIALRCVDTASLVHFQARDGFPYFRTAFTTRLVQRTALSPSFAFQACADHAAYYESLCDTFTQTSDLDKAVLDFFLKVGYANLLRQWSEVRLLKASSGRTTFPGIRIFSPKDYHVFVSHTSPAQQALEIFREVDAVRPSGAPCLITKIHKVLTCLALWFSTAGKFMQKHDQTLGCDLDQQALIYLEEVLTGEQRFTKRRRRLQIGASLVSVVSRLESQGVVIPPALCERVSGWQLQLGKGNV